MKRSSYMKSTLGISLLVGAFLVPGCMVDAPEEGPVGDTNDPVPHNNADDADDAADVEFDSEPLARIESEDGSVEWHEPTLEGDTLEVVITSYGLAAPILHPDFVESVGPIKAYMAASDPGSALPESLRSFATEEELAAIVDETAMTILRTRVTELRDQFEIDIEEATNGDVIALAGEACTAGEKAAARSFYGAAYSSGGGSSGSKTCGNNTGFNNTTGTSYYCNFGNCDQDYELALGNCAGIVDNNCTTVGGDTTAQRARFRLNPGSGAAYNSRGTRFRFGFYNCDNTVPAVMKRRRGNGSWIQTTIDPNSMTIRVGGTGYPPQYALAHTVGLGGSIWKEDHNWSGGTMNQMEMVSNLNGYMCGDVIQKFRTYDASAGSCNGYSQSLCDDSSCSGPGLCFD